MIKMPRIANASPLDVRDVAVHLETEGVTDSVAREDYGYGSTWEMAQAMYPARERIAEVVPVDALHAPPWIEYLKGISFGLPLLISCVFMFVLKFSLWGGEFPEHVAEAIGLGTISSFIVTGGFVQAMARRGLFYAGLKEYQLCQESTRAWLQRAVTVIGASALAALGVSAYFNLLPADLNIIALSFHVSLGMFWLGTGVLYMLDRSLLVAAVVVVGLASVSALHLLVGLAVLPAQVMSILIAAGVALVISAAILHRQSRGDSSRMRPQPFGRVLYFVWPYFAYGCLYYIFLFIDRLLAWTAHTGAGSLHFQFRGDYETALDIALFAFIFQVGWVRSATARFYRHLKLHHCSFTILRIPEFNSELRRFYFRGMLHFAILALVSSGLVFFAAAVLGMLNEPTVRGITVWALAGFPFLVLSLWNVSLLFALSRPLWVLASLACGSLVDLTLGYVLSRLGSYSLCVIGFTAGALVLAACSSAYVLRVFRRLDYHYFASTA